MTKQRSGLILFWIAVVWAFLWGVIGSISTGAAFGDMTTDEVSQTIRGDAGTWFFVWAFSVPLAALVAAIGVLLHSGAKGSTIWKYGIGIVLGVVVSIFMGGFGHIPPLFGIGGTLILLSFIGVIWLWGKERRALKDSSTTPADLRLAGYIFLVAASWFICGIASQPFTKAFEGEPPPTPIHVMVLMVLSWLFFFLSHYTAREKSGTAAS